MRELQWSWEGIKRKRWECCSIDSFVFPIFSCLSQCFQPSIKIWHFIAAAEIVLKRHFETEIWVNSYWMKVQCFHIVHKSLFWECLFSRDFPPPHFLAHWRFCFSVCEGTIFLSNFRPSVPLWSWQPGILARWPWQQIVDGLLNLKRMEIFPQSRGNASRKLAGTAGSWKEKCQWFYSMLTWKSHTAWKQAFQSILSKLNTLTYWSSPI